MRNIEVAMNYADRATAKLMRSRSTTPAEQGTTTTEDQKIALLNDARARIEAGKKRLERLLDRHQDQRARVFGLLAATEKRCAEVYFSFTRVTRDLAGSGRRDWQQLLFEAHQHYWETFALNRDNSWGVVQYLSLDIVLRNLLQPEPHLRIEGFEEHNRPANLWKLAEVLSVNDLRTKDEQRVRWAFGNLTELYLIAPMILAVPPEEVQPFADRAVQKAQDLVDRAGADSFEVYSTRRQVLRYEDWYAEIANIPQFAATVARILNVLPAAKRDAQT
jgi:hypothetical protein